MKTKLMTTFLAVALTVAAAPLVLEQLDNLRRVAEDWTRSSFLHGIVAFDAGDAEPAEALVSLSAQSSADEFRWNGRVAAGKTVEVRGVNGGLSAEPGDGNEVEVTAVKTARRSDPKEVEIRVVEHAGGVLICALYPSAEPSNSQRCVPGEGDGVNIRNNDVTVEFKVRVPRNVNFRGRTVNGNIETGALGGDVEVKTVNGSINVTAAGVASAKTVNGSITARLGRADWNAELDFKTVNGGITLDLPSDLNADVTAKTQNGEVTTDFPVTLLGRVSRKQLNGTIGGGGRALSLKTVNGNIQLRRAS
jgi:hypothetical protein